MARRNELSTLAQKNILQLDAQTRRRVLTFLSERGATQEDPRSLGNALNGSKPGNFWKYRVGDYRIIADIQDSALCILAVRIGNRREVYQ